MKFTSPVVGFLTIVLLVALPVGGTPALKAGSEATYDLKSTISFAPIVCETPPSATMQASMIMCPMIATVPPAINVIGRVGWSATAVTSTTAVLNVTRDLTTSHDGLMVPSFHETGSFNESVDLATRIISIMPFFETEIDAALQSAQMGTAASLPTGVDPSLAVSTIEPGMIGLHHMYTMWWVNETLHQGQTIPVLVFNTTVTGPTSLNLGGLGPRGAWTLVYNFTKVFPIPMMSAVSTAYPSWTPQDLKVVLTFNYDQKSGLLLSASADVHRGFELIAPLQCGSSTATIATVCNVSSPIAPIGWCGFDLNASLTLASTNLNLDETLSSTTTSTGGGTTTGSGGSSGTGAGGSGNSGSNSGGSSAGNSGSNSGSGSTNNRGTTSGSGSPSSSRPAPSSPSSTGSLLYLILGLVVVALVVASLLFVRRRNRWSRPQTPA